MRLLRTIGFIVVSTALSLSVMAAPNIVFFVADDLGWRDVGYHDSEIRTPTIDRLADEGLRLERFYSQPVCSPTRAALLTGRSTLTTGVLMPFEPWHDRGLPLEEKLLPEYLKDAGYQTFAIGKWHLGPNKRPYHPLQRGFDHFYGHLNGFLNYETHTLWRGVDWQRNGKTVIENGYATHLIADEAVRMIRNRDKQVPMFLYVTFNAPHTPLQAPAEAIAEYSDIEDEHRRTFAAMVTEMDKAIAQVLGTLDDEGLSDDTLVFFMSDNGGGLRLGADNGDLRGGKGSPWEGGIRVPAVMRWPGMLEAGADYDSVLSVEDILPTIFGALGETPNWKNPLYGTDQWPALTNKTEPVHRTRILARHNGSAFGFAVFRDEWKLVQVDNPQSGKVETHLFRIFEDPNEKNDLAAAHPGIVESLLSEFQPTPDEKIVSLGAEPVPTMTGIGGPSSLEPDNRPPQREPYAETAQDN